MKPLGRKHQKALAGHQDCFICRRDVKDVGKAREKRAVRREIEEEITCYNSYMDPTAAVVTSEAPAQPRGKVRQILAYPNPLLTVKSSPFIPGSDLRPVQALLADLQVTMQTYRAAGLAAIQIGVPLQVAVVQLENGDVAKLINPTILSGSSEKNFDREGCLSLPGTFVRISRPESVTVSYFDELLNPHETNFSGGVARAVLHELEHLCGAFFLDNVSNVERSEILRKNKLRNRKVKALHAKLRSGK